VNHDHNPAATDFFNSLLEGLFSERRAVDLKCSGAVTTSLNLALRLVEALAGAELAARPPAPLRPPARPCRCGAVDLSFAPTSNAMVRMPCKDRPASQCLSASCFEQLRVTLQSKCIISYNFAEFLIQIDDECCRSRVNDSEHLEIF
jgi:hypothetical protein